MYLSLSLYIYIDSALQHRFYTIFIPLSPTSCLFQISYIIYKAMSNITLERGLKWCFDHLLAMLWSTVVVDSGSKDMSGGDRSLDDNPTHPWGAEVESYWSCGSMALFRGYVGSLFCLFLCWYETHRKKPMWHDLSWNTYSFHQYLWHHGQGLCRVMIGR